MFWDLFFPNRCLRCDRLLSPEELVCPACREQIPFTQYSFNGHNHLAQKARSLFPVENAYALLYFVKDSIAQKAIHQLKYSHREIVGKILANEVISKIAKFPKDIDLVTVVPLHPKKKRKRGYNQISLFAKVLCTYYKLPYDEDVVIRRKYSKAQASKSKFARRKTQNIFEVNKKMENTHLLIIDDVFTTGNTMSAIAWEFLKSGKNNKISILVMAMD